MKNLFSVLMVVILAFSFTACTTPKEKATKTDALASQSPAPSSPTSQQPSASPTSEDVPKFGMITDVGGVNDQSFNQSAWEGMKIAEAQHGIQVSFKESKTDADYAPNIEQMVDNQNDLVLGVGFKMGDAIKEAATNYPDNQFAIIDHSYAPQLPNVTGVLFKQNECSYLVGVIAAKMSETKKIGHINGMNTLSMNEFAYGYYAGILSEDPTIEIFGQYADSFTDPAKGKAIANQMYSNGCDIIYSAAGDSGNGVIESAKEKNKWVIGVDRDQNYLAPDNVLTSAMKRVDIAVLDLGQKLKEGSVKGGKTVVYGLESKGVDIAPSSSKHVPKDILDYVEQVKAKIISGKIKVPANETEFKAMYPDAKFMK